MNPYGSVDAILEDARGRLTGDPEHDRAVISEAALYVRDLGDIEQAELHSYATCSFCGRIYTEAEWARLPADGSKPWQNDGTTIEEHRFCTVCEKSIAVIERLWERIHGRGVKTMALVRALCERCHVAILPGDACVIRVNEAGQRERGIWCSEMCEGQS